MEKKNDSGDAPDPGKNTQNPESPEIITLSSDDDDECDNRDTDESVNCPPTTSNDFWEWYCHTSIELKKEVLEETSKTEVSSEKPFSIDVNKASSSKDLSEAEKELKNLQQQPSLSSNAASSVSKKTTCFVKDLSEDGEIEPSEKCTSLQQQPSSSSNAASSVSKKTTCFVKDLSEDGEIEPSEKWTSLQQQPSSSSNAASSVSKKTTASPRVLLRRCDDMAREMGAEVWRQERIVWAPFGKHNSYWPGVTFSDFEIKRCNKPKHKFVLWLKTYNYSEIKGDYLLDFKKNFSLIFNERATIKNKAVLEALEIMARMSYISLNTDLMDWGRKGFNGFMNRDEVLIQFLQPILARLKHED